MASDGYGWKNGLCGLEAYVFTWVGAATPTCIRLHARHCVCVVEVEVAGGLMCAWFRCAAVVGTAARGRPRAHAEEEAWGGKGYPASHTVGSAGHL